MKRISLALIGGLAGIVMATAVGSASAAPAAPFRSSLPVEGTAPGFDGAVTWLNSAPLTSRQLRGKVVLVDFWTYSCINCLRTLPYLRAWAEKYKDAGLVVVGVHTPEFAFEKRPANVRRAVKDLGIGFPVAVDSDYAIWRAFGNQAWPAFYFVDAQGRIRHQLSGEGQYTKSEQVIQQLLAEAGQTRVAAAGLVAPQGLGTQAAQLALVRQHAPAMVVPLTDTLALAAQRPECRRINAPGQAIDLVAFSGLTGPLVSALAQMADLAPGIKAMVGFIGFVVALISLAALRNFGPVLFYIGLAIFAAVGLVIAG
eukprot:gene31434-35485_t